MAKKTKEQISFNMKQVKNKNSKIEILLRKELWKNGLRYRKHVKNIFGCPDIAFQGKKIAVFCDSEFWHGYDWEHKKHEFKSRQDFWIPKIERNMERDKEVTKALEDDGWTVLRFWGKDIKNNVQYCVNTVKTAIEKNEKRKK
ncbi:MAG: very short patch repair endonuclease [Spirochaetales bacterium]